MLSFYGGAYSKKFFMLHVSANLRPLLLLGPPPVGWEKWSRICNSSKHSGDIAVMSPETLTANSDFIRPYRRVEKIYVEDIAINFHRAASFSLWEVG